MKKRLSRRIKRVSRARIKRRPQSRVKSRSASRAAKKSTRARPRRASSSKKRTRLEAADILLLLCLFALIGGIALLLYLHFAKGLVF